MKNMKTFEISVASKKPNHLFYNVGSKQAFTINGEENKTLKLIRGCTYKFNINAPTHPFYFTNSSIGGSQDKTTLLSKNENRTDNGVLIFKIRKDLPNRFYYQCGNHPNMGGKVEIVEPTELINCFL